MKKLIVINGTPGAGKTTVSRALNQALEHSVWLDGDWCWMMNPFVVNEENKAMVEGNINHMLSSFLSNSSVEYVVFNWVIGSDNLMEKIMSRLKGHEFHLHKISLVCSEDVLRERLKEEGRSDGRIEDSVKRLPAYDTMDTVKIDTSDLTVEETVKKIMEVVR